MDNWYVSQSLVFESDKITIDGMDNEVMMSWEDSLMSASAAYVTEGGGDILEIGFGMGISGGYMPLSAVLCHRQIADKFWGDKTINPGFVSGHTFEANPIACAAGLATIGEIIEKDLCSNTRKIGNYLREGLESLRKHTMEIVILK